MIVVLVGFIGLALDLGKLYVSKSELQNRADSCALAAARDLTGATPLTVSGRRPDRGGPQPGAVPGQPGKAAEHHIGRIRDLQRFAGGSLSGQELCHLCAEHDQVRQMRRLRGNIANWFAQVLNAIPGIHIGANTVGAFAVATTTSAQTTCAILCISADPTPLRRRCLADTRSVNG
jgi:hypothetical protein